MLSCPHTFFKMSISFTVASLTSSISSWVILSEGVMSMIFTAYSWEVRLLMQRRTTLLTPLRTGGSREQVRAGKHASITPTHYLINYFPACCWSDRPHKEPRSSSAACYFVTACNSVIWSSHQVIPGCSPRRTTNSQVMDAASLNTAGLCNGAHWQWPGSKKSFLSGGVLGKPPQVNNNVLNEPFFLTGFKLRFIGLYPGVIDILPQFHRACFLWIFLPK